MPYLSLFVLALMIVEMLCVNLYVSHICLDRKASPALVIPVMAAFTALLLGGSVVILGALPGYGEGFYLFFGFLYLIPLALLYRRPIKTVVSVMCLTWSYTMLAFLFSQYLGRLLPERAQTVGALVIQTAVYLLTLRLFLHLLHEKLLYVVAHAGPGRNNLFFCLSISTCALAFCVNWVLNLDTLAANLALVCALAVNTMMMYQTLYVTARSRQNEVQTRQESLTDALTGLSNRRAFFEHAEELVREGRPFSVAFLDLDRFKSINDTYGHMVGDWYLRQFAQEFTRQLSCEGVLYRVAGDEFVFLRERAQTASVMLEQMGRISIQFAGSDVPFLGFSCGAAAFPDDAGALDELLAAADSRMYQNKTDRRAGQTSFRRTKD